MELEYFITIVGFSITLLSLIIGGWITLKTTIAKLQTEIEMIKTLVTKHDAQIVAISEATAVFKEVAKTLSEVVRNAARKEEKLEVQILDLYTKKEDRK